VPIVAAAHELLGEAAKLAKEAREIEKYSDSVLRMPHARKGELLKKTKLMEKPSA
jgi:methylenetetrahydromethanopterin dehydrogenase